TDQLSASDLALMCAEEDPLNCHRFLMICPAFVALGIQPLHIRKGGVLESQREAENRLLRVHKLDEDRDASLFPYDREAALKKAYFAHVDKPAFRRVQE